MSAVKSAGEAIKKPANQLRLAGFDFFNRFRFSP